ncbi:hypothetical protein C8F01DRAFT_1262058 [Mycena amicta]|nr:hypothetical protein C8F01DRAFT_1262058 [Mycena amicta]
MCHHTKPKCQYFMNLNKIAQTATIRDYPYDLGEDSLQTLRMLDLLTVRADVQNPLKICRGIRAAPTFAGDSGKFQLGGYMPLESCVSDTLVGFMQIPADLLLASAVLPTQEIPTFRSFEPRRSISAVLTSLNALVEGGTIHRANVDFMLEACPNCEQCWAPVRNEGVSAKLQKLETARLWTSIDRGRYGKQFDPVHLAADSRVNCNADSVLLASAGAIVNVQKSMGNTLGVLVGLAGLS